jgi:hypothetical protein
MAGGNAVPLSSLAREARGRRAGVEGGDKAAVKFVGRDQGSLMGL